MSSELFFGIAEYCLVMILVITLPLKVAAGITGAYRKTYFSSAFVVLVSSLLTFLIFKLQQDALVQAPDDLYVYAEKIAFIFHGPIPAFLGAILASWLSVTLAAKYILDVNLIPAFGLSAFLVGLQMGIVTTLWSLGYYFGFETFIKTLWG